LFITDSQGSTRSDYEVSAATHRAGLAQDPGTELTIQGGDLVDVSSNASQWQWLFDTGPDLWASGPVNAVSGNHDTHPGTYGAHFNNDVTTGAAQEHGDYYSFGYDGVHFVMLNTNDIADGRLGAEQAAWIEDDVAAARDAGARWVVVVMHKGIQTVADHIDDDEIIGMRAQLQPVFERAGVDL